MTCVHATSQRDLAAEAAEVPESTITSVGGHRVDDKYGFLQGRERANLAVLPKSRNDTPLVETQWMTVQHVHAADVDIGTSEIPR